MSKTEICIAHNRQRPQSTEHHRQHPDRHTLIKIGHQTRVMFKVLCVHRPDSSDQSGELVPVPGGRSVDSSRCQRWWRCRPSLGSHRDHQHELITGSRSPAVSTQFDVTTSAQAHMTQKATSSPLLKYIPRLYGL